MPIHPGPIGPTGQTGMAGPIGPTGATGPAGSTNTRVRVHEFLETPNRPFTRVCIEYDQVLRVVFCKTHDVFENTVVIKDVMVFDGQAFRVRRDTGNDAWVRIGDDLPEVKFDRLSAAEVLAIHILKASGQATSGEIAEDFKQSRKDTYWQNIMDEMKPLFEICRVMMT